MPVETEFPGSEWEHVFQFSHSISWTYLPSFKDCKYTAVKSLSQGNTEIKCWFSEQWLLLMPMKSFGTKSACTQLPGDKGSHF